MSKMWDIISNIVEAIANFGAGAISLAINYEPQLPEELRK